MSEIKKPANPEIGDALPTGVKDPFLSRDLIKTSCGFAFLAYFIVLIEFLCFFTSKISVATLASASFAVATTISYPLIYIIPVLTSACLVILILGFFKTSSKIKKWTTGSVLVVSLSIVQLMLFADHKIFTMFKFHFNGFVWNLITTPGGATSMGAGNDIYIYIIVLTAVLIAINSLLFQICLKGGLGKLKLTYKRKWTLAVIWILLVIICGVYERLLFGLTYYKGDTDILNASLNIPFYMPTTLAHMAKRMGIKRHEQKKKDALSVHQTLNNYPLNKITESPQKHNYNIVWLVAESWRADTVTPEIMPATTTFSKDSWVFKNHYSAGNGTRMALFGMFYGLYGSYWIPALSGRVEPVIMKVLRKRGYQFDIRTSAKFTYPEFENTIFSHIPKNRMHQSDGRGGFVNDRRNVSEMLEFIKNRDKDKPFMTFLFFESPHAPYTFPEECVIRKDYLPHINYATVNIKKEIHRIKNRYINSVHHLDTQFSRIFNFLKRNSLMRDTIVIVTGDHGEEFLEAGHWGHNSEFHQEEIRPPFILRFPGGGSKIIRSISSHLDIQSTVAGLIGVENPPSDYSFGINLIAGNTRQYTICSDWDNICYIDNEYKYTIPTHYSILSSNQLFTKNDKRVSDESKFFETHGKIIRNLMSEVGKFK